MGKFRTAAWVIVVGVALALSNWSLAYIGRQWQVTPWLAWSVSFVFDGVALLCADLALKAARRGDSTFAPGMVLMAAAGLSAWLNSYHAQLAGDPWPARVMFAAPPLAAVLVTELQLRHDRRDALREAGRISLPLPAFGGATWVNKPFATYRAERKVMAYRLSEKLEAATGGTRKTAAGGQETEAGTARQLRTGAKRAGGQRRKFWASQPNARAAVAEIEQIMAAGGKPVDRKIARTHDLTRYQAGVLITAASSNGQSAA